MSISFFIKFDIAEFCQSISKKLLSKVLEYAQSIEERVIKKICHARRSLLFDKGNIFVEKDNREFDIAMGSYDGAEFCKLFSL